MMRCPGCREAITIEATEHSCGWRASSLPPDIQASTPPTPPEPPPDPAARKAAHERMRALLKSAQQSAPPDPLTRWRRILAEPNASLFAQERAAAAISQIERRSETERRIREGAALQERARAIVADQLREEKAERMYEAQKRRQRQEEPAPPAPARRYAVAPTAAALRLAEAQLEAEFASEGAGARPANARATKASRGSPGARQTPYRAGSSRAKRR